MVQLGLAALLMLACASPRPALSTDAGATSDSATPAAAATSTKDASATTSDVPAPAKDAACPLPTHEENGLALVESAEVQPPWVEIDATLFFPDPPFDWMTYGTSSDAVRAQLMAQRVADLAPTGDDLVARLRAIGARQIIQYWVTSSIAAIVPAGRLPEIPCWPNVTDMDGDGLTTDGDPPDVSCFASTMCTSATCTQLLGARLDLAHACARHAAPAACSPLPATDGAPLTCYVELATGQVFAVAEQFLIEMGDTAVRKCSPAEGGTTAPALLPECP